MIVLTACPCCPEGKVGFRLGGDRQTLLLLCDACALVWTHPTRVTLESARDPLHQDFQRQFPGLELQKSRWAREEDVSQSGWSAYLLKPSELLEKNPENPANGT